MKRPAIRLAYAMELIAGAAIGLGLARSGQPVDPSYPIIVFRPCDWVRLVGGSLLTGLALAGSVGLLIETARGRRPSTWGIGRWIWSSAGFFMVFYGIQQTAVTLVVRFAGGHRWNSGLLSTPEYLLQRIAIHQFFGSAAWAIAAVCATAMLARSPHDPEPDAREWSGRLFASLTVALNIAEPLMRAAGR